MGQDLSCILFRPDDAGLHEKRPTVIVSHGLGGSQKSPHVQGCVQAATDAGLYAVTFNLRGAPYTDEMTPDNMFNDVDCATQAVAYNPKVDPFNIFMMGVSYTAYGALMNGAKQGGKSPVKAFLGASIVVDPLDAMMFKVMLNPICVRRWQKKGYQQVDIEGNHCNLPFAIHEHFSDARNDIVKEAAKISQPVLLIHGTKDRLAPLSQVEKLAQALPNGRLHVIKGAGHDMAGAELIEAKDVSLAEIQRLIGDPDRAAYDSKRRGLEKRPQVA